MTSATRMYSGPTSRRILHNVVTINTSSHGRFNSGTHSALNQQRRGLFGFGSKKTKKATDAPQPLLSQDDLFHPLSKSPFKEMREKSQRIKQLAFCPVSLDKHGEKVHVQFECPDCGYPTHANEQRWAEDTERGRYWPRLREANEDEHDLRSGREMTEFTLPGQSPRSSLQ